MTDKNGPVTMQIQPYKQTYFYQIIDNLLVMVYRGLLKICRTPEVLFDVTLMPILFIVMFSYIFGGAVSGNVRNYLPILVPGILVIPFTLYSKLFKKLLDL